jgi:hypothetical protein
MQVAQDPPVSCSSRFDIPAIEEEKILGSSFMCVCLCVS